MLLRWVSICVWALVAASAVFWGLRLLTKATPLPPQTQVADLAGAVRGDLDRVLGADAPALQAAAQPEPGADARFNLVGVVSPRGPSAGHGGVALISVDGKAPRAYKLGAVVEGQNVLQAVNARGVTLGPRGGPALVALNIPPPQPPATGQLPPPGQAGAITRPLPPPQPTAGPLPPQHLQPLSPLPSQMVPPPPSQVPPQVDSRGNQLQ